jgi:hypothetical protein
MSCLDATFTLTPLSPFYSAQSNFAYIYCFGADFWVFSPEDFSSLYANNRFFFDANYAADPNLDYTQWANIRKARHLYSYIQLQSYTAANKQLALIFGFDVRSQGLDGRVLVYSNAGLLQDQKLVYGDNQFLLEIESLDLGFYLYFIHAGGHWSFTGLSGYVV